MSSTVYYVIVRSRTSMSSGLTVWEWNRRDRRRL